MLTITAFGTPAPQGSKRHVGHGVLIESSKNVKPWRETVKWAAIASMGGAGRGITGPVRVDITFTLAKPASARKSRIWPDRRPDLDKLLRSTMDGLTEAGAWEDDGRCVRIAASKVYPGEGHDALMVPGAVIRIHGLTTI